MHEADLLSGQLDGNPQGTRRSWDVGAISGALRQDPEPSRDIAHGPGVRYALAEGALTVELFPPHAERTTGIVRLSTADSRHEFFRQPEPVVREDGLIFQSHEHLLTVTAAGQLTHRLIPPERHQGPGDESIIVDRRLPQVRTMMALAAIPCPHRRVSRTPG